MRTRLLKSSLVLVMLLWAVGRVDPAGAQFVDDEIDFTLPGVTEVPVDLTADLNDWLWRMEQFGMHGAVLVARDGRVILQSGYGVADHGTGAKITSKTIFDIGSLSKQFTAAAILKLQMQGRLRVEDRIGKHLSGVPEDKQQITIHQLLTHTSGLPYQPGSGTILVLPLQSTPGERFSYSNPGYSMLADVIEVITGESYQTFIVEDLFKPSGMTRTGFRGRVEAPGELFARSYTDDTAQSSASEAMADPTYRGAGGVVSCVGDLYKWELALLLNTVLSTEAAESFFAEHVRNDADTMGYAYGWMTATTARGSRVVLHQGNFGGFNSDYRRYVDEGLTLIFLSNHYVCGSSMRDAVTNHLSRLVNGRPEEVAIVPQPPHTLSGVEADVERLAGIYRLHSGESISLSVSEDGTTILATASGQESINALFSPSMTEEQAALEKACGDVTKQIITGAFINDSDPLRTAISPGLPFDGAWSTLRRSLNQLELQFGAFKTCRMVGTALSGSNGSARTYADVAFVDGSAGMVITFSRGQVVHMTATDQPPTCELKPFLSDGLCWFDIFTGEQVTIMVDEDFEGVVHGLMIERPFDEPIMLERVG